MAARRRRRLRKRTRRQLQGWGAVAAVLAAVWVARNWARVWPVLLIVLATAVLGTAGWSLWRAHRAAVGQDRQWRAQEEAKVWELPEQPDRAEGESEPLNSLLMMLGIAAKKRSDG
ncbi:hypothetical protein [Streptomyces sp. NPDC058297]|uniref:hypothetical protein n=1 Tax=Streptomyces sp. NPDC058297 TaxID=3346433 RepID=UPI0036EBA70C